MPKIDIPVSVDALNTLGKNTMLEHLGITITASGPDFLKGTMPVDSRTVQPMGLLHGGASAALAETLGSLASLMNIDPATHYCVGLEINANHIRAVRSGMVTGTATAIHLGRTTHIWDIRITDEHEKLVCISRLTMAILPQSK